MSWYLKVLKQYADFSGRARRKEYWMFTLFNFIISIALAVVDAVIGTLSMEAGIGILGGIYTLAILIPSIAVQVRRLHDIGRSGWWLLIGFIPLIGVLVLLYWACKDSEMGDNQYGPNPKSSAFA